MVKHEKNPTDKKYRSFDVFPGAKVFRNCLLLFLLIIVLYSILIVVENNEEHSIILREDGIVEYTTAALFLLSSFLLLISVKRNSSCTKRNSSHIKRNSSYSGGRKFFLIMIAIVFFLIAMEEISWGQRIIGWDTGGWFSEANEQNETNIHNADTGLAHWGFWWGTLLLGVLIPYGYFSLRIVKKWVDRFDFPVLSPDLAIFFLLPFLFSATSSANKSGQIFELLLLCTIPVALSFMNISKPFMERQPPDYGTHLALLLPAVGIPLFFVHELFMRHFSNPALEMRELLISVAFLLFAFSEFARYSRTPGQNQVLTDQGNQENNSKEQVKGMN